MRRGIFLRQNISSLISVALCVTSVPLCVTKKEELTRRVAEKH